MAWFEVYYSPYFRNVVTEQWGTVIAYVGYDGFKRQWWHVETLGLDGIAE